MIRQENSTTRQQRKKMVSIKDKENSPSPLRQKRAQSTNSNNNLQRRQPLALSPERNNQNQEQYLVSIDIPQDSTKEMSLQIYRENEQQEPVKFTENENESLLLRQKLDQQKEQQTRQKKVNNNIKQQRSQSTSAQIRLDISKQSTNQGTQQRSSGYKKEREDSLIARQYSKRTRINKGLAALRSKQSDSNQKEAPPESLIALSKELSPDEDLLEPPIVNSDLNEFLNGDQQLSRKKSELANLMFEEYQQSLSNKKSGSKHRQPAHLIPVRPIYLDKEDEARLYNNGLLKKKAFKILHWSLYKEKLALRKMKNELGIKIMRRQLRAWRKVSILSLTTKLRQERASLLLQRHKKAHFFMLWLQTAVLCCKGRAFGEYILKQKAFKSFKKAIAEAKRKNQLNQICIQHRQKQLLRQTVTQWSHFTAICQQERQSSKISVQRIQQLKQKQILLAWSTHIGFLKRDKLGQMSQENLALKLKRKAFMYWVAKYNSIQLRKTRGQRIHEQHIRNFMTRHFNAWLEKAQEKTARRQRFVQLRANNINRIAFQSWHRYANKKSGYKSVLRRVVLLRATHLCKLAMENMKEYLEERRIKRKMNQAACISFMQLYLKKAFDGFKKQIELQNKGKRVQAQNNYLVATRVLTQWKKEFKNNNLARFFQKQTEFEIKQNILNVFKRNRSKRQGLREQLHMAVIHRNMYLQRQTYRCIIQNTEFSLASKRLNESLQMQVNTKLAQKAMVGFKVNKETRQHFKGIQVQISQNHDKQMLKQCMHELKAYKTLRNRKKICEELLYGYKSYNVSLCFQALKLKWQRKVEQRQKVQACIQMRNQNLLFSCIDGFQRYLKYKQHFSLLFTQGQQISNNYTKQKVIRALIFNSVQKIKDRNVINHLKLRHKQRFLCHWADLVFDQRPKERQAKQKRLHTLFTGFVQGVENIRQDRIKKEDLNTKQEQFLKTYHTLRVLRQFHLNAQNSLNLKKAINFYKEKNLSNLFTAWQECRPEIQRSKAKFSIWHDFLAEKLLCKAVTALETNAKNRQATKQIISIFQNKHNLVKKNLYFQAIIDTNYNEKIQLAQMAEKFYPQSLKLMSDAFVRWQEHKICGLQYELAEGFVDKRLNKLLLRRTLKHLRLGCHKLKDGNIKRKQANQHAENYLTYKAFRGLVYITKRNQHLRQAAKIINKQTNMSLLSQCLNALQINRFQTKKKELFKEKADQFAKLSYQRRAFYSFINNIQQKQRFNQVHYKIHAISVYKKFLPIWRERTFISQKIGKFVNILEEQQQKSLISNFLPRMANHAFYNNICKQIEDKRLNRIMHTFLTCLRKQILQKKIMSAFMAKSSRTTLVNVFNSLKLNMQLKKERRELIMNEIMLDNIETDADLMYVAFRSLHDYTVKQKFKKISAKSQSILYLRRAFTGLCLHRDYQQKTRASYEQTVKLRKARYFWHWCQTYKLHYHETGARGLLHFSLKSQIISAWKRWAMLQRESRQLLHDQEHKRLIPKAFISIKRNWIINKLAKDIRSNADQRGAIHVQKQAFRGLQAYTSQQRIKRNMTAFFQYKQKKQVLQAWKQLKEIKNEDRLKLVKIRASLRENPELTRPLIVLKNFTVFKAFQALVDNIQEERKWKANSELSYYAMYLRLLRKSFIAIKQHVALNRHKRQSKMLKRLAIQKRWFNNLKQAAIAMKIKRRMKTDAAIFRFLSLQRKGYAAWIQYSNQNRQEKIKRYFARSLYFKRLADKVLTSLKMYKDATYLPVQVNNSRAINNDISISQLDQQQTDDNNNKSTELLIQRITGGTTDNRNEDNDENDSNNLNDDINDDNNQDVYDNEIQQI